MHIGLHSVGATQQQAEALGQLDIVGELEARLSLPVIEMNDGTAACRAEYVFGSTRESGDLAHIFIGTYVGAGIHLGGRFIESRSGQAANLGAFLVPNKDGNLKDLHWVASVKALESKLELAGRAIPNGSPTQWDWSKFVPEAEEWLSEAAIGLAMAIANTYAVVDFSTVIIDGTLPDEITARLVGLVSARMTKLPVYAFKPPVVVGGTLGESAPAVGAAYMPLHNSFFLEETPEEPQV
jgi:predicted NBD/HSP70 family sugar kinase